MGNAQIVSTDFSAAIQTRMVWVLNSDFRSYTEDYRGKPLTVPPNSQKIPKRIYDGGNLMEFIEARMFLGNMKVPQKIDGKWVETPKALRTEELTEKEYKEIFGKDASALKKEAAEFEKKSKRKLNSELKKVSNKVEVEELENDA